MEYTVVVATCQHALVRDVNSKMSQDYEIVGACVMQARSPYEMVFCQTMMKRTTDELV